MLPLRVLAEIELAVEEERAVPPLLEWYKHPQDHNCPDGGTISFHSLRNYWQERLEDKDLEDEEEVTIVPQHVGLEVFTGPETWSQKWTNGNPESDLI